MKIDAEKFQKAVDERDMKGVVHELTLAIVRHMIFSLAAGKRAPRMGKIRGRKRKFRGIREHLEQTPVDTGRMR